MPGERLHGGSPLHLETAGARPEGGSAEIKTAATLLNAMAQHLPVQQHVRTEDPKPAQRCGPGVAERAGVLKHHRPGDRDIPAGDDNTAGAW